MAAVYVITRPLKATLNVSGKAKQKNHIFKYFFPKMFSVILGKSFHTDAWSSAYFSDQIVFNSLFDNIKMG